ncbi:MAG TPA: hypothetical protein VIQ02_20680 [Jiangellaceae bacterium]
MRAALADLEAHGRTEVFSMLQRIEHDQACDCDDERCQKTYSPSFRRSDRVSARRALHTLARDGVVELSYVDWKAMCSDPSYLIAKRCPVSEQATHTEVAS